VLQVVWAFIEGESDDWVRNFTAFLMRRAVNKEYVTESSKDDGLGWT